METREISQSRRRTHGASSNRAAFMLLKEALELDIHPVILLSVSDCRELSASEVLEQIEACAKRKLVELMRQRESINRQIRQYQDTHQAIEQRQAAMACAPVETDDSTIEIEIMASCPVKLSTEQLMPLVNLCQATETRITADRLREALSEATTKAILTSLRAVGVTQSEWIKKLNRIRCPAVKVEAMAIPPGTQRQLTPKRQIRTLREKHRELNSHKAPINLLIEKAQAQQRVIRRENHRKIRLEQQRVKQPPKENTVNDAYIENDGILFYESFPLALVTVSINSINRQILPLIDWTFEGFSLATCATNLAILLFWLRLRANHNETESNDEDSGEDSIHKIRMAKEVKRQIYLYNLCLIIVLITNAWSLLQPWIMSKASTPDHPARYSY